MTWALSDLEFVVAPYSINDILAEDYATKKGVTNIPSYTIPISQAAFKKLFYDSVPAIIVKDMDVPGAAYEACKEVLMQCHIHSKDFPEVLSTYAKMYCGDFEKAIFFRPEHVPHVLLHLKDTGNIHKEAMCPFAGRCELAAKCRKADALYCKEEEYSCTVARNFMITDTQQGPYFIELKEALK